MEVKYPSPVPPFLSTTVRYVIPSPIQPMSLVNASLADILQDNDCTVVLCGTGDEGRAAVSCFLSTEEENERLLCLCFGSKGMLRLHQTKIPAESVMRRCQRLLYCVEEDNSSGVPPTSLLRGDASANLWLGSTMYFAQDNLGRAALRCGANWRIKAAAPETFDAVKQLTVLQDVIFPGLNLLSPSISSVSFTAIDQCAFSLHVSGTYLHLHPTLSCFPSNSCHPVRVTLTSSAFSAIRGEALFTDVLLRSIQEAPVGHPGTLIFDVQIASDAGKAEYTDVPLPVPGEVTLLYTYALYHYGASWIASDPADVFDHVISLIPLYLSTPSVFLTMMEQFDQVCAVAERHLRKRQEKASGGLIALFGNLTSSSTEPDSLCEVE
ncbi:hypothetical protein AGDE_14076 [Angomonas deanei]|uniref:Uncharacterized protein n=1 Tax=Angomonas deanei TaxID=59799 RepID=A0A7G2CPE2_9TRYP|nr:hypothetical protein AGDE_14076 [Angomonas deanei]CAD2220824.1 hypothetical protein, conserved [Angomonas deanei]|eukprot:EPY21458.1 hypothetical protein AGDE_14076 [Angomonas deanei]